MTISDTQASLAEANPFSPTEIVVKLLNKAISSIEEAIEAIEINDIEARCNAINLTSEIVSTLHLGLDFDNGGDTADRLGGVYRFVLAQLIRINIGNDAKLAQDMIEVIEPLRDAWTEVDRQVTSGQTEADVDAVIAGSVELSGQEIARVSAA